MQRAAQTSESIELAVLLALSGGMMDAYSYLARGGVFANAQTGNMLLLGVNLADGNWARCVHYAMPVACFALGIALAHLLKLHVHPRRLHWRQFALVAEIILLCVVAGMPSEQDLLANSLTSFACGIQVQAFRKLHGRAFATTMCIGNLRSGTQDLVTYLHTRERSRLEGTLLYYGVIVCFVIGAVIGARLIGLLGLRTILVSPVLLAAACAIMLVDRERRQGAGADEQAQGLG
jgi:uncharacterized membrane protein YoaK (UPF0700 family)